MKSTRAMIRIVGARFCARGLPVAPGRALPQRGRRGFTLLEVMLAVTILAVVTAAVYGIWSSTLSAWKRGMAMTESFQRGRVVLETLDELTKALVFQPSRPEFYQVVATHDPAGSDSVSFVTGSDRLLPVGESTVLGMRRVTLGINRDKDGRSFLGIANTPASAEESDVSDPVWHVLSRDVVGFGISYRNPRDGTWQMEWTEKNLMPSAIKYTVAFVGDTPGLPPVLATRAVEFPVAAYVLETMGVPVSQANTTNEVTALDINLSELVNTHHE